MNNLLIIGNGFDLAHGLKSSYSSFIEYLINSKLKDNNLFSDLFEFNMSFIYGIKTYKDIKRNVQSRDNFLKTKNRLFKILIKKTTLLNWCDIEKEYFLALSKIGKEVYRSAKELNLDFEVIKKYLSEYLKLEEARCNQLNPYSNLFRKVKYERTLILNFNYTNTVKSYLQNDAKSQLVQIYGEIDSIVNPIIFGYAADNSEARKLLHFEDKEFMRNIKKHNYKRTQEESRLRNYLQENNEIVVSVLGHSCGISDKLILNQIFNHENIAEIRVFYYKEHEHYFETQVNIDRIMNNDTNFQKLINFQDSLSMPQYDDPDYSSFNTAYDATIKHLKNQYDQNPVMSIHGL